MTVGSALRLEVFGESHAPAIGMRLQGLPGGMRVDRKALKAFLERRAPGRSALSTARREPDEVEFVHGLEAGRTVSGETLEAIIRNTDTRSADYERTVPRPGHADYPNFVKTGRIPPGGGANSGRMTAAMCIAGGICLQALSNRGIKVGSRLVRCGGAAASAAKRTILAAKAAGDSVGGVVECTVTGLPTGLGGPMFEGLESALAPVLFGIPGVKGLEFGNGFAAADERGSVNNDPFAVRRGRVVTLSNRHGGILGGMASGMPLVLRVAFKPTPSVFVPQRSVDLKTMKGVTLRLKGRHDPCIAIRAMPVVEAMTAFALYDALLAAEGGADPTLAAHVVIGPRRLKLPHPVVDATVARLYPELKRDALMVLPSGERHKTMATVERIWRAFARAGLGRKDLVTAVGGGVTNDLVGFAAATWMRGIDWISVPTTLLAMTDASFGGKTGCDLAEGKNLAGAFHAPRRIYLDDRFLKTLAPRELAEGRAEMIKHEIIGGLPHGGAFTRLPDAAAVMANREVKRLIVARDPLELTGERAKLNCGHTLGHAVEKASGYRISHGEAVAIGCVGEARLAERRGFAAAGWADELKARFAAAKLPTELPKGMTFESLLPLMRHDKKNVGGRVVFALPCGWGDVRVVAL